MCPERLRPDAASAFVLSAIEAASRARLDGSPRAFLVKSGIGGLLNFLKRERRQRALSLDAPAPDSTDGAAFAESLPDTRARRPDVDAIERETATMVRAAVKTLRPKERTTVEAVLMGNDGESLTATSARLGQSRPTIYLHLRRATGRLRRALAAVAP